MVNYLDSKEVVTLPLQMEGEGRNPYRTGYGNRIKSPYVVEHISGRKYRVYSMCHSNAASHYITIKGVVYFLPDWFFN